ncbi:MAG TPA: glycosyltransferase [Oscillatoriales cyanobacterium M59_W2019_021]|nr:glycosyltransferase [Oscillatoriales cyanobacterium M4454_W2019_049]HIK52359.1 glycosyltransferase [Oscillatoriales cyanobacterium M59_W2019_021]
MSEVLIITGMHRSGTSLMASFIQNLGIDLGNNLLEADKHNPKGYFEDVDFVEFQRSILPACCNLEEAGWQDWGWTQSETIDRAKLTDYREMAQALIDRRQPEERNLWGWKDPRTSLLLDFWDELLPEARYLFVYRYPWDVVDSIVRLHSVAFHERPHYALQIWAFYNRHLLNFYDRHPDRCLLVNINSILENPSLLVDRLQTKFNLNLTNPNPENLKELYNSRLFGTLKTSHPLIQTIGDRTPQYLDLLSNLDRSADIPSSYATQPIEMAKNFPESLPLSLASKTPEVQSMPSSTSSSQIAVSVIIPCYNQGEYLLEAIASVQNCQESVYELIVVNDCSRDPVTEKVLNYLRKRNYNIIDTPKNVGLAEARNIGIRQAKGRYILPLDADNKIYPQYITKAIEILDSNSDVGIVYGDMEIFGDKQEVREVPDFDLNLIVKGNYIDACAVFRRQVWEDCGGYDSNIPDRLGYEDWDFWLMAAEKGWKFSHLPEVLFQYRFRLDSMVSRCNLPENRHRLIQYICAKHLDLYETNFVEVLATKEAQLLAERSNSEIIKAELEEYKRQKKQLEADLKAAHEQLYQTRLESQHTHERLRQALSDVQNAHEQLNAARTESQQTHERLNRSILESQQTHEQLNQARIELQKTHERLHESILNAQQTHQQLYQSRLENQQVHQQLHQTASALEQLQIHLQEARNQIQAMENTKFWKLRTLWFKLKAPLGKIKSKGKAFFDVSRQQGLKAALGKTRQKIAGKLSPSSQVPVVAVPAHDLAYQQWLAQHFPRAADLRKMADTVPTFRYKPTISIIVPVYNTPEKFLRDAIESVLNQIYPYWELCVADDASTAAHIKPILQEYAAKDARIKVTFCQENGHISRASNAAIALATGDFIALLDHDDLITPDALYEVVLLLNKYPDADMIYSDEDKVDENNQLMHPFFKPDWCPDSFLSRMYTCHLGVYRRSLVNEIGGFRVGFEGSQDYDLVLRLTEKTEKVYHIPKILYHWRLHAESTATGNQEVKTYAYDAAKKAITEALERRGEPGTVLDVPGYFGNYTVRYQIRDYKRVSIIIPTRNLGEILDRCLSSIFAQTTYPNYEVVVVDNGSTEAETADIIARWTQREPDRFKCYPFDIPFNYPTINNFGVSQATGDYLLFLNNDTKVLVPDWLEAMVEQAQRPEIGAVGALLLYEDDTIQHAGIMLGIGGVAGHSHRAFPKDTPGYVCQVKTVNNFSAVTGACLMCRREVFDEVGGLDETLAVAYNDVDFCLKLVDRGYRNIYLPHVVLYHYESKSRGYEDTPEKLARLAKEANILRSRWKKYLDNDPCYNPNLTRLREDYSINELPPSIAVEFDPSQLTDPEVAQNSASRPDEIEVDSNPFGALLSESNGAIAATLKEKDLKELTEIEIVNPQLNGMATSEKKTLNRVEEIATVAEPEVEDPKAKADRVRRAIAAQYLQGEGIEVGALHSPLQVPETVKVRYVDRLSVFDLRMQYPELNELPLVDVDIIDDGEVLGTIPDASVDFVIANHMLEHCQNPIATLKNYLRVVKPGGTIYLAIPDKRYTFDRDRPVTTLEHLIRDDREGPETSQIQHFEEYVRLVDRVPETQLSERLRLLLVDMDFSIHFHVWTPEAFTEFLTYCQQELPYPFELECLQSNEAEFIAILRKGR